MTGREVGGPERENVMYGRASLLATAAVVAILLGTPGKVFSQQTSGNNQKSDARFLNVLDPFTMHLMTVPKAFKMPNQRIADARNIAKEHLGMGSTKVDIPRNPSARSPFVPPSWVSGAKYPNKPGWFDPGWLP